MRLEMMAPTPIPHRRPTCEGVAVAERSQVAADGFRAPVPRVRNRTCVARVDKILGVVVVQAPAAAAKLVVSA